MLQPPNVLTIAGSDSGAGAGIQADIKTIMALGGYGLSVITALTAQNGLGVTSIHAPDKEFMRIQLQTIFDGFDIHAAKTGMLFSKDIIETVAQMLENKKFPLIVDPVSVSQSGSKLLLDNAISCLCSELIPLADLLTPNKPETEILSGVSIKTQDDLKKASEVFFKMGAKAVLIKGGHFENSITITDWLFTPNEEPQALTQAYVNSPNNHGTGCTLSAAIATGIAHKLPLIVAIKKAQEFVNLAMRKSYAPGKGCGPLNHNVNM